MPASGHGPIRSRVAGPHLLTETAGLDAKI